MPTTNKIEMIEVRSSNIQQIGYSEKTAKLFVRFKDGGRLYYYDPVPPVVWLGLRHSQSKGSYLHTQIIPFFRCTRAKETDLDLM
jgi:KTSC domain